MNIQKDKTNRILYFLKSNSTFLSYSDFYFEVPKLFALLICHLNQQKYFNILDLLIDSHPSEQVRIDLLDGCIDFYMNAKQDKQKTNYYYQKLIANFPDNNLTYYYRAKIEQKVKSGSNLQNFVTRLLGDTTKKLSYSGFKGKFLLIDFWSTTCGPCIAEFPFLLEAYNKYNGNNFKL